MSPLHGFKPRHGLMPQFLADKMREFMPDNGKEVM